MAISKHLSVGTFAVVSLMVYSTISELEITLGEKYYPSIDEESVATNSSEINSADVYALKLKISTALCFWCGCVQVNQSR